MQGYHFHFDRSFTFHQKLDNIQYHFSQFYREKLLRYSIFFFFLQEECYNKPIIFSLHGTVSGIVILKPCKNVKDLFSLHTATLSVLDCSGKSIFITGKTVGKQSDVRTSKCDYIDVISRVFFVIHNICHYATKSLSFRIGSIILFNTSICIIETLHRYKIPFPSDICNFTFVHFRFGNQEGRNQFYLIEIDRIIDRIIKTKCSTTLFRRRVCNYIHTIRFKKRY